MLPKSKYLTYFQANEGTLRKSTKLIGDLLIVEKVQFPEQKVGSIILAESKPTQLNGLTSDQPLFFRVLYVGEGYYDADKGEDVAVECKPGDIILTGSVSVKLFSRFPMLETTEHGIIGLTRFSDCQWHFSGQDEFEQFLTTLNTAVKAEGK